jgi:hypothetical protein
MAFAVPLHLLTFDATQLAYEAPHGIKDVYHENVNFAKAGAHLEHVLNFDLIGLGKSVSWSDAKKAVSDRCQR